MRPWTPPDTEQAYAEWRANCGPAALAAITGRTLAQLRAAFPRYPAQPWTNPTHMKAALDLLGVRHEVKKNGPAQLVGYGLCFIQWEGPWLAPGVPIGAAYRNTHWVATAAHADEQAVYDVNAGEWITRAEWEAEIVPVLLNHTRRATGWHVRTHIAVLDTNTTEQKS